MITFIKNLRLSIKVSLLGAISVLITATALLVLATWQSGLYNRLAQHEVEELVSSDLDHITNGVYHLVEVENEVVQQQVDYNLKVAHHLQQNAGKVHLSKETVMWNAVNQYTKQSKPIRLPKMLFGNRWLGQNTDLSVKTDIIDDITSLVGETATIFQRINEQGDMLRIATNVQSVDGKRAIGTFIPAINPDGTPNPVVSTILRNETYHGRAYVVNAWYLTAYEPLRDHTGKLVGMLYVGVKQQIVEARIRPAILQTEIGKTGYVYILAGKGARKGHYIISKNGERDGENLFELPDKDMSDSIRKIIDLATSLKSGEMATAHYRWRNKGEKESRKKVARFAYFEPWDWVIAASVYEDEIQTFRAVLTNGRHRMMNVMMLAGVVIILFMGFIGVLIARSIAKPVHEMQEFVETIIEGNLDQTVEIDSKDEIGSLATSFNIMTERLRETMEGLHKSEKFLNDIIENIPNMIVVKDAKSLHYVRFNKAGEQLLGTSREDLIGKSDYDIYPEDVANRLSQQETLILTNNELVDIQEEQIQSDNKGERILHTKKLPILDNEGKPQYLLSISEDITEYKQTEEERIKLVDQLQHSQRLEAIGRLAGGVAHDFNNILTGIIGYSEMLLSSLPEESPDYEDTLEIRKAAERAAALTSQLLAFSRKQIINPKVVDINNLIYESSSMLMRLIGEDITYMFVPGQSLGRVRIDPGQIEQVLLNLAVNARDAMPQGGKLIIKTKAVEITEKDLQDSSDAYEGDYILLSVTDTGSGIDSDILEHLFEPFFTTKPKGSGTGLGLSTVYGIMKQNQGFITVDSTLGKGTTFKAYFPMVEDSPEQVRPVAKQSELPKGNETILLVEDEEIVRNLTKKVLNSYGYQVLQAENCDEALKLCHAHQGEIDLLLSDVVLPGKSGLAMYESIEPILPDLKVIFMSGYTENVSSLREVLEKGTHFIPKPFTAEILLQTVREVLDSPDSNEADV